MLVVTRKRAESIAIGRDIQVTVLAVRGQSVRLGIEAPRSVAVVRSELVMRFAATAGEICPAGVGNP